MLLEESPVLKDIYAEKERATRQDDLLRFLRARFKEVPPEVIARIQGIRDLPLLEQAVDLAGQCESLEAFQNNLPSS